MFAKQYRQVYILYLALVAGQVLFAGVTAWLSMSGGTAQPSSQIPFHTVVPLVLIGTVAIAWFGNQRWQEHGANLSDLGEKIEHYRRTVIRRLAFIEAGNLLAVVAALLTGEMMFLLYFVAGMAAFLFFRPTTSQFSLWYNATPEELRKLK